MAIEVGTNSYVTLDEAEAYYSGSLNADAWFSADASKKEKALISAFRNMQTLNWKDPKPDPNNAPPKVKQAQMEHALQLLNGTAQFGSGATGTPAKTKKLKAGSAEIEYFQEPSISAIPDFVMLLLADYLESGAPGSVMPMMGGFASGTDRESYFDGIDHFTVTEGY